MDKATKKAQKEAIEYLQDLFTNAKKDRDGNVMVYVTVASVSSSGMFRKMRLYVVNDDREIQGISIKASYVRGYVPREDRFGNWCVPVHGTGMDMTFAVVNDIQSHTGVPCKRYML